MLQRGHPCSLAGSPPGGARGCSFPVTSRKQNSGSECDASRRHRFIKRLFRCKDASYLCFLDKRSGRVGVCTRVCVHECVEGKSLYRCVWASALCKDHRCLNIIGDCPYLQNQTGATTFAAHPSVVMGLFIPRLTPFHLSCSLGPPHESTGHCADDSACRVPEQSGPSTNAPQHSPGQDGKQPHPRPGD